VLLWGFLVSLLGAVGGYYQKALSGSGLVGAVLIGTLTTGFGGWLWLGILVTFFISASLLSQFRQKDKKEVEQDFAKTGRRDVWQVLANGGLGAILAILNFAFGPSPLLFAFFVGVIATVNADTWATELGVLSKGTTRSILNGQRVTPGTSGGMSLAGTLAGVGGAVLIGLVAELGQSLTGEIGFPAGALVTAGLVGGFLGCLIDSLLGATVQIQYLCRVCGKVTERLKHCHQLTRCSGGWSWVSNDLVNLVSSAAGGFVAAAIGLWKM
jgi:uncharacterized protein (TIGR00297 family)